MFLDVHKIISKLNCWNCKQLNSEILDGMAGHFSLKFKQKTKKKEMFFYSLSFVDEQQGTTAWVSWLNSNTFTYICTYDINYFFLSDDDGHFSIQGIAQSCRWLNRTVSIFPICLYIDVWIWAEIFIRWSYLLLINFFTNVVQVLQHRWKKCVDCKGDYVKK